jgi:hypothetical protein
MSHISESQEIRAVPEGETGSLKDTEERHCKPPQVPEATSDKIELQEEEHQYEQPQLHDAIPEQAQLNVEEDLQSCSQVQFQVDESRTMKESPSVVSTCETREEDTKPHVKSIFSSFTFTNSPSFSNWTPFEKTDEHRMRLRNVTFEGCEQNSLQIKSSCDFANVKFIGCKFDRTVFMDVKLCSVTFVRVDFTDTTLYWVWLRNVRLFEVEFDRDLWRDMFLKNALVDKHAFKVFPDSEQDYVFRAPLASSKTIRCELDSALSFDDLAQELRCSEDWKRDIYLCEIVPKGDILSRLCEHKAVMDRIMQYCFPGPSIHIFEYPDGVRIPGRDDLATGHDPSEEKRPPHRGQQFVYSVVDTNSSLKRRSGKHLTTYFGSMAQETPKVCDIPANLPRRGTGSSTALLRVNRAISKRSLVYLYGRTLHLQCSAVGAREFLVAHRRQMKLVKELVIYFHWERDGVVICSDSDINPWIHLLNTLRHEFSFIPTICIHVGQYFWCRHSNWTKGAEYLLKFTKSPFMSIPKIAAPEPRWQYEGKGPTHRTNGKSLKIFIEGTEGEERTEFVQNLADEIEKQRVGRPLFVGYVKYQCFRDLNPYDRARAIIQLFFE